MSTDASLPSELAACQRALLECRRELSHASDELGQAKRSLKQTESVLAETAVVCEEQQGEIERIKAELELFKRYIFGRRSERHVDSPGQGRLFAEPDEGAGPPPPADAGEEEVTCRRRRRRGHGWSKLPDHLPRQEVLVDVPPTLRVGARCRTTGSRTFWPEAAWS